MGSQFRLRLQIIYTKLKIILSRNPFPAKNNFLLARSYEIILRFAFYHALEPARKPVSSCCRRTAKKGRMDMKKTICAFLALLLTMTAVSAFPSALAEESTYE